VAVFAAGVVMLAAMAVFVIAALYLARHTIQAEAAEALGARRGAPPGEPARAGA
jgi:hypothetical protein